MEKPKARRGVPIDKINEGPSKTALALKDVDAGMSVPEACRKHGVTTSSIYAALRKKKAAALNVCPTCLRPWDDHGTEG